MSDKVRFSSEIDQVGFTRPSSLILFDTDISDAAFRMYNVLQWYARNKDHCFPGVDKICIRLNKTKKSIYNSINELKNIGLVSVEQRYGQSNIYIMDPLYVRYSSDSDKRVLSDNTLTVCNLRRVLDNESNSYRITSDYSGELVESKDKEDIVDNNKSRKKNIINIKSAASAVSENYKSKIKKNREKSMMVPSKKMDNQSEKNLIKELGVLWFDLWIENFGDIPFTRWAAKEKTIVKYMLKKHDYSDLRKLFEYVFSGWRDLRVRFKLNKSHAPTIGLLSSMSDIWIQDIARGKPNLKKDIINRDEFREDGSPDIGWGNEEEDSTN